MKFGMDVIPLNLKFKPCTLIGSFKRSKMTIFKLLTWMKNSHQSTWQYEILYFDRSLKDDQLLIDHFFGKQKIQTWSAVES
jgi:hypothetical protein